LSRELAKRGCGFKVLDKSDMDLSDEASIPALASIAGGFNCFFMLASEIGVRLFQSDMAAEAGRTNRKIYDNVMSALLRSGVKGAELFYYSTSEVYWSMPSPDVYIDDAVVPGSDIDYGNPRSVYAAGKLYAERNLRDRTRFFGDGEFSAVNVIRPFNVYGPGQRRGVMYSMMRSGLVERKIRYSDDTTRTLTELSYISKKTVDLVGRAGYRAVNMFDGVSVDMETLAGAVQRFLSWKTGRRPPALERLPPDRTIRYRQSSAVIRDPDAVFERLKASADMNALFEEISAEAGS